MKNEFSSRRIVIPAFALIILFSVLLATHFFSDLQNTFRETQRKEIYSHLEDFSSTMAEDVVLKFQKNWESVESISIFCESYAGDSFADLKSFLHRKKYDWKVNDIAFYTENGNVYDEKGTKIFKENPKSYLGILKEVKRTYCQDGTLLDYLQAVETKIRVNNERIIAVSTSINIDSVLYNFNTSQFDSQSFFCLIDNNGKVAAKSDKEYLDFPNNLFTYLKDCDVVGFTEGDNSVSHAIQESVVFRGLMNNTVSKKSHFFICYPIIPKNKYAPTQCHLLVMVPDEVINKDHYDFSHYITRVSIILIAIICILMLLVFLLAYKSKSKLIQDSMEQKEISQNERLKVALAMAEQSNTAKTSFLSNMSHDIRTPLNAIISMSDFALQEADIPPKVFNYLEIIKKSSHHLMQLINNVLDMTRIESGKMIIKQEPFDMNVLIDDVTNIIRSDCKKKKITLYVESSEIEHNFVVGDKMHIQRILINLLNNAVKFTPELGSIWFTIEENESLRAGTCSLKISVEDTGMGIKKENIDKIFSPFTREDTAKVSNIEGSGLGLAITKNLVETMGGSVTVTSEENKGTKFVVEMFFPISTKTEEEISEKSEKREGCDFGGITALVVEDNPINRTIIKVLLERINIVCDFAENGRIAVEKFNKAPTGFYKLVYMDIQMPELNGYETTETLRNGEKVEGHTIPIIAMTANVFDEDVEKCRKAGMNAHIGKPIDPNQLAYVTNQVLCKQQNVTSSENSGGGYVFSDN